MKEQSYLFGLGQDSRNVSCSFAFHTSFRAALVTFKVVVLLSSKDPGICRSLDFPWKRAIHYNYKLRTVYAGDTPTAEESWRIDTE